MYHTDSRTNQRGVEKRKPIVSGDSARLKLKITISAFRTKHGDLSSILFRYQMYSVTCVCPCDWSDLLSAVDLTLNLIRNMKKSSQLPRDRERAFSNVVTVHRIALLWQWDRWNEERNGCSLIDDIRFNGAFFEVLFIAYVTLQSREEISF